MKNRRGRILIFLGLLLIAAALGLSAFNLYDQNRAGRSAGEAAGALKALIAESHGSSASEVSAQPTAEGMAQPTTAGAEMSETGHSGEEAAETAQGEDIPSAVEIPDFVLEPDVEMPVRNIRGRNYIGILQIPAHGLELPVIGDWSYSGLRVAPCRYAGSAYKGDMVIAAHNYSSHFGKMKYFSVGEQVVFTDADGNVFAYEIVERETLKPTAVEAMKSGDWDLTLFTCTGGGSYRLAVRCECIGTQPAGGIPD